jgi:hypothetical protein
VFAAFDRRDWRPFATLARQVLVEAAAYVGNKIKANFKIGYTP